MTKFIKTSPEYNRRTAIIEGLRVGRTSNEIIRFFGYSRSTVYNIAQRYAVSEKSENGSSIRTRKDQIKKKLTRTPRLIIEAQNLVSKNPGISLKEVAAALQVSETVIRQIAQEDLRYTFYVLKVCQMLSEADKLNRFACCNSIVCSLKRKAADRLRFFSDEKVFITDRKNDCWLARDPKDIFVTGKTKLPPNIHILSVISSEGDVMPPYFIQRAELVTEEVYLEILRGVVKPWMETVASGRPYIFQQTDTPVHTSSSVQNWLINNVDMFWSKDVWPPNSTDLNPLDYYVWGLVERTTNKCKHPNVISFRAAVEVAFTAMDRVYVKKACSRFRPRLEMVIEAEGDYIKGEDSKFF